MPGAQEELVEPIPSVRQLLSIVKRLPAVTPIADAYDAGYRAERRRKNVYYDRQKQHVVAWLREAGGAGYYGRQKPITHAKAFYNNFKCVAALIWLAEALGVPDRHILDGVRAVEEGSRNPASECGAFRAHVPWDMIGARLAQRKKSRASWLSSVARVRRPSGSEESAAN